MLLAAGAHYVVPDFAWVQDVGGSLMVLADQLRRAIAWIYRNAVRFGIDPTRLYVGGQSSGGHLAAVALTTDWPRDFGLPADIIKGGHVHQRHVRSDAGAADGAQLVRRV
jgi:arylformamidase